METLTLNDGTVLNGTIMEGGSGQEIYVYLQGMSLSEGFMIMNNPNRTKHIIADNRGTQHVYDGFTVIFSINNEFGNCNLTMRKAVNAE